MQLLRNKARFSDRGASVRSWLLAVTARTCSHRRRAVIRRRRREEQAALLNAPAARPETTVSAPEVRESVFKEVERLPETYRRPLELRYFKGLTFRETAGVLRTKANTTQARVVRGLDRLRRRLAEAG
jgi:RNA polymerase sigma-70 factor (ECF subfamily)